MDFEIANKGSNTKRGLGRVWYAEISEFSAIQDVPAAPASQAEKVTIINDHTFTVATDGFRLMYTEETTRMLEAQGNGEIGAQGGEIAVNCFFPGNKQEFMAFIESEPELIVIVEDYPCNVAEKFQLGSQCRPARIAPDWKFTTGTSKEGMKGFEVKIVCDQPGVRWYTGAITEPTP